MHSPHVFEVRQQRLLRSRRQHRHAILAAFALPHGNLIPLEVEVRRL
jgi:hypothetical protein